MTKNKTVPLISERGWFLSGLLFFGLTFLPFPTSFVFSFIFLIPIIHLVDTSESLWKCYQKILPILFVAFLLHHFTSIYIPMKLADKVLLVLGFNFFYASLFLIPITIYYLISRRITSQFKIWLLPLCWLLYEYVINQSEIGIAVLSLHNTLNYFPFFTKGLAYVGTLGYTALVLAFNVFIYQILISKEKARKERIKYVMLLGGGFVLLNIVGSLMNTSEPSETVKVAVVQPNFNHTSSMKGGEAEARIKKMVRATTQISPDVDLIVWPETSIQGYVINMDSLKSNTVISYIRKQSIQSNIPILAGAILYRFYKNKSQATPTARPVDGSDTALLYDVFNTAILITPDSLPIQIYVKNKLVPFVERMPYIEYFPFAEGAKVSIGDAYPSYQILKNEGPLSYRNMKILPLICSEGAYFNYAVSQLKDANIIVSVSNEGWTGKEIVTDILNNLMFPLSNGLDKSVVKCSNNGTSFGRDNNGITLSITKFNKQEIMEVSVPLTNSQTFYSRFAQVINFIIVILFLIPVLYGAVVKR
ncbi:MAG: apolipoprotein N-acyltransferase [Bacteroidota bacterium]